MGSAFEKTCTVDHCHFKENTDQMIDLPNPCSDEICDLNAPHNCMQTGSLNVACFNTHSIVNKLDLLKAFLMHFDIDLLFIIESWLNAKIPDSLFSHSGYNILRDDRLHGRGGCVLLLYKGSLNVIRFILACSSNKLFEFICVDVHCVNSVIRFSSFYIPPYITASFDNFRAACEYLISCHTNNHPHFICGDFNLPSIDWTVPVSFGGVSSEYFVELCCDQNFIQHVLQPTHDSGNILDLLLCDWCYATWLVSYEICPPFSNSCDHSGLLFRIDIAGPKHVRKTSFPVPHCKKACYETMFQPLCH